MTELPRRTVVAALLASAIPGFATAASAQTDPWDPLRRLRRIARPLVVFAPEAGDERLREQRAAISAVYPDFAERDQVLIVVAGENGDVTGPPRLAAQVPEVLDPRAVAALRKRFGVAGDEFAVILVGKDGGEKLRETEPLSTEALFGTIDAMPMRRREMERGG